MIRQVAYTSPDHFKWLEIPLADGKIESVDDVGYYIVERKIFDQHLYEAAIAQGAQDYAGCKLINAEFDESGKFWNLVLQKQSGEGVEIQAQTLVGADGAGSRVRRIVGLELNEQRHRAVALRAYAQTGDLAGRAMRVDWIYSLLPYYGWVFPLTGDKVNIGIILEARDYKSRGRSLGSYLEEYISYLSDHDVAINGLGDIKAHSLPLASAAVPLVPKQHAALIGDAAAMINPFTGEGIHYGVWAGHSLGTAVGENINQGKSVQATLEGYARMYAERFDEAMRKYEDLRRWVRFQRFLVSQPKGSPG